MPSWNNIDIKMGDDPNINMKQFEIELNRRLRYYLANIDVTQLLANLNDIDGTLRLSKGGTGSSLGAPADDRIMFYDLSGATVTWLDIGAGLDITGTILNTSSLDNIDGTLSLSKGGTGSSLSAPGADRILFYDQSGTAVGWLTVGTGLSITGTTLSSSASYYNVNTKTTTSTLTVGEAGLINCNSASAITINLPTASGNTGLTYSITNINTGTVTIDPNGTETIQGDSTFDLYENENLQITSDGSNWYLS